MNLSAVSRLLKDRNQDHVFVRACSDTVTAADRSATDADLDRIWSTIAEYAGVKPSDKKIVLEYDTEKVVLERYASRIEYGRFENGHQTLDGDIAVDHSMISVNNALRKIKTSISLVFSAPFIDLNAQFGKLIDAYNECALWSARYEGEDPKQEALDEDSDTTFRDLGYAPDDVDTDSLKSEKAEIKAFIAKLKASLPMTRELAIYAQHHGDKFVTQFGHHLWLSRNGHGAGFFDDDANLLQAEAKKLGEVYPYANADGSVQISK